MNIVSRIPGAHPAYLASRYLPELDGLRAISILGVITAHVHSGIWSWLSGGRGVLLFFTISGYLITRLLLTEEAQRGAVNLKAFYVRRAFRLFPAYYLVLGLYCLLIIGSGAFSQRQDLFVAALPYYLLYLSEIPGVLGIDGVRGVAFAHSWSLGIEEKFYLVFPVLIFGLLTVRRNLRLSSTVALMLFFMATPFFGIGATSTLLHPYCNILIGCVVALVLHDPALFERCRRLGKRRWLFGATVALLALHFAFRENTQTNVWSTSEAAIRSLYTCAMALFLAAMLLSNGWLKKALGWGPLVSLGKLSYGVYLVHILCLNAVERALGTGVDSGVAPGILTFVLACAVSIGCAFAVNRLVERPGIGIGRRISARLQASMAPVAEAPTAAPALTSART
jgi:peptidoglycan/LPS O-acetylase OafA/YrhL